jgi:dTDP-glucose 4,6-dehydratase
MICGMRLMLARSIELGWKPSVTEQVKERTMNWYLENQIWLNNITSGEMQNITKQYT